MRVLMLNPPYLPKFSRSSRSPEVCKGGNLYFPYWISYATGVLEDDGHDVNLVDAVAREMTERDVMAMVVRFGPEMVVIDTSTPSIYNDMRIADKIKEIRPDATVALVGTHPTALPDETLETSQGTDIICHGEYDHTVRDLARGNDLKHVKGISYRKGKKIFHNPDRPLIEDLDKLPFVSRVYKEHLGIKDYFYPSLHHPQITILTARGCPYRCSFCPVPFKGTYRTRSIENVIKEMKYIQDNFPEVKEVMFEDDTFPVSKERTERLCEMMIAEDIDIKWSCNARVNTDFETLNAMKAAGCRLLCVGFESPNKKVLESSKKGTTRDMQVKFMEETRALGLLVNGCFVLGLKNDTAETVSDTIEFAKELNPHLAQFYPLMIYPQTADYAWAKYNGHLTTEDYSKWLTDEGVHACVVSRAGMSAQFLEIMCDTALRGFYFRPSKIAEMLTSTRSVDDLKRKAIGAKSLFSYFAKNLVKREAS